MTIGILGAGAIGSALALQFSHASVPTIIANRRGVRALMPLVAGLSEAIAGTIAEAASADIVIIAVPWNVLPDVLGGLPDFAGRIVIDATNPIGPPDFKPADLGGRTSSEVVADMVPGARVIKAFNTLKPDTLAADPHLAGGRRVIAFSGDDRSAKAEFSVLLARLGFAGLDLGTLVEGGRMQQFPGGPLASRDLIQMN